MFLSETNITDEMMKYVCI